MDNLTDEEVKILNKIESAGKWDALFYDLAYLIPTVIIIILSAVHSSILGIFVGLTAYLIIRLWASVLQCKAMPLLKSAIKKIKKCQPVATADRGPLGRSG